MPSLNFDDDPVGRPKDQWQRAISGLGAGVIMVVFVVVIFGAGYAMVHHAKRSAIFQRQAEPVGASSRAKPSPGIPFGAKPPAAPPPVLAPVPADSVPAAITEAPTPGAAPVLLKAKDTEAVYTAKHLKIFGRGCEGRLSGAGFCLRVGIGRSAALCSGADQGREWQWDRDEIGREVPLRSAAEQGRGAGDFSELGVYACSGGV